MIVLDTSVLVYAVGEDHPLRGPSRRLLQAHGRGQVEGATTVEVIQEFAHVRARRRTRTDGVSPARQYAAALRLVQVRDLDLDLGLTLYERYSALGAFDAVLAAVALNLNAQALVSADRAFGTVPHLPWVDLGNPDLVRLLGG